MRVAQRLYEGVDLGEIGTVGLITYMRTDSPRVSSEAIHQVRGWIKDRFGEPYLPSKPNAYKSRKGAQEAHEAIRPTLIDLDPEKVKTYLEKDQWALYKLIWDRFVASQMASAVFLQTTVEIKADDAIFTAIGSVPIFKGFMALYVEGEDNLARMETKRKPCLRCLKGRHWNSFILSQNSISPSRPTDFLKPR